MVAIRTLEGCVYFMGKKREKLHKKHPIIFNTWLAIAPTLIMIIIGGFSGIYSDIKNIAAIKEDLEEEIEIRKEEVKALEKKIDNVFSCLLLSNVRPTKQLQETISNEYNRIDQLTGQSNGLAANTIVAYSEITQQEYSVEELSDLKLLLPYTSNGQEIIFYGQFNEKGQWNGQCILNVYENDELILITDAEYQDGTLLKSKQVFSYEINCGERVWALSDRTYEDGVGFGDTYLYEWNCGYTKEFVLDDVMPKDVLYADEFISILNPKLEAYYSGNTSDGYFNDDTGNAYMVYFFEDGTVRLLYSGKFKDGTFNDDTGNAWYIVKEEDTAYIMVFLS